MISLIPRAAEQLSPITSLVKEWFPLWGPTWSWPSAGFLSALCPAWLRAERCSTSEVRSCPFSSHQIIYLLAKTKLIPAQRKLMRPIHCSRICHRSWCSPRWVTDWNIGAKFSIYIVEFIHQENCLIRGHLSVVSQKMPLHCTND